jgi:hypothetical protein
MKYYLLMGFSIVFAGMSFKAFAGWGGIGGYGGGWAGLPEPLPSPAADVRWLDQARRGEALLVGRTVYFDLSERDRVSVEREDGSTLKLANVQGLLLAVTDIGTAFDYVVKTNRNEILKVSILNPKSYEHLQNFRWIRNDCSSNLERL